MGNHLFVIFAVLDVSCAVNLCINHSFLHLLHINVMTGAMTLHMSLRSHVGIGSNSRCLLDDFLITASASAEYSQVPQRYHGEKEVPARHRLVVTDW